MSNQTAVADAISHGLPGRPDPWRQPQLLQRNLPMAGRHQRPHAAQPDGCGVARAGSPGSDDCYRAAMAAGERVVPQLLPAAAAAPGLTIGLWAGLGGWNATGQQVQHAGAGAAIGHGWFSSPVNWLSPLTVLGVIRGRRGEPGAWELLDEALVLAEGTGAPEWIVPVRAARAELRWLANQPGLAVGEAGSGYHAGFGRTDPWLVGWVAIWLSRLGQPAGEATDLPEPFALEMAGDWPGAAAAWEQLGRPYDAALARLGSKDEAVLRQALAALEDLGARPAAAAARRQMKTLGIRPIPRGPRPATRADPAGLTAREQEVLALLSEGLSDREISRRLFISERTVGHHVSAILAKIGVSSRTAAACRAARLDVPTLT